MADVLHVTKGAPPWLPSPDAELVAEFSYYDVPLSGVIRQHGVDFYFQCLDNTPDPVSFWMYLHVTESERERLESAPSPEDFDRLVGDIDVDRPVVLALALERLGILSWRTLPAHIDEVVKEEMRELVNELYALARQAGSELGTVRIRSRVATTHPIAAYGGIQLSESVLHDMAKALRTGAVPMHVGHDIRRPLATSNVDAGVEKLEDGYLAVWAEFDVDADAWAEFEAERDASGAPGGISFSATEPITRDEQVRQAVVAVAADASYFDDSTILRAARELELVGTTGAERLYQFAFTPDPKVVLELATSVVTSHRPKVLADALYNAARIFIRPGLPTTYNISLRESPDSPSSLRVHLSTDDAEVLRHALSQIPSLLRTAARATYAFSSKTGGFEPTGGHRRSQVEER